MWVAENGLPFTADTEIQNTKTKMRVEVDEIATPTFGRFAMTGEDVGNSGCDCHDMLSACLAMTERENTI